MPRLTDKPGLAEYLSISERTVEKWCQERKLPFIRISPKCVRFDLDDIDAMLAERVVPVGGTVARKAGRRAA